jgi:8-oxo-dGTP pyrophosphatase MutT (NUDIX family)
LQLASAPHTFSFAKDIMQPKQKHAMQSGGSVPWATLIMGWERELTAPCEAGVVETKDNPRMEHVYAYALPVLPNGFSLLQVRDRPRYTVGLFGGEVELWDEDLADVMRVELATTSKPVIPLLPRPVWAELQRELWEEMGLAAESLTPTTCHTFHYVSPRSGWRSYFLVVNVVVNDMATTQPQLRLGQVVSAARHAVHWGVESLGVITLPPKLHLDSTIAGLGMHRHHDMFLRCAWVGRAAAATPQEPALVSASASASASTAPAAAPVDATVMF